MKKEVALSGESRRSVLETLGRKYGMEAGPLQVTLARTIFPSERDATPEQVAALCVVATQYDLNPFTKEIYAFPSKGGGITPILAVDGWFKIINRHPEMDGLEVRMGYDGSGKLESCSCTIHRKDRKHPTTITEYLDECKRGTPPWNQSPKRMLRHRAITQCARVAFGISGLMEADEAESVYQDTEYEVVDVEARPTLDLAKVKATLKEKGAELHGEPNEFMSDAAGAPVEPVVVDLEDPDGLLDDPFAEFETPNPSPPVVTPVAQVPWTEGEPHGGYPYDVSLDIPFHVWKDQAVGGRTTLKELVWSSFKVETSAYWHLEDLVKTAAEKKDGTQSVWDRRAAIVVRWTRELKAGTEQLFGQNKE